MYLGFHLNIKQHNIDYSLAPNQQIRMFSEGSCDTEDWSRLIMLKNTALVSYIHYILKCIKIQNSFF